jgi:hypothetical protein
MGKKAKSAITKFRANPDRAAECHRVAALGATNSALATQAGPSWDSFGTMARPGIF